MRKIGSGLRRKIGLAASAVCVVSVSWLRMPVQTVCASEEPVILRVCNWEEYIDLGEWDDGREVRVEYSCFGTNEDLYNQLNLGDTYDLVCPSEYMIMKLMAEDRLLPYSDSFYMESDANNYYINNVSPYIRKTLETNEINGESWGKYAAGYMWGITGVLYNPELVTEDEAATWGIFGNPKFHRQVTLKDNVRDSYFAALGILNADVLTDEAFVRSADYRERLADSIVHMGLAHPAHHSVYLYRNYQHNNPPAFCSLSHFESFLQI